METERDLEREKREFEWQESNDEVLRQARGEPPLDSFYGTDKGGSSESAPIDTQSQSYAPASQDTDDAIPRSLNEVVDALSFGKYARQFLPTYQGPLDADGVETVRQGVDLAKAEIGLEKQAQIVRESEARAHKKYGQRAYENLFREYVQPLIEDDRRVLQLLYFLPDPAEGAYLLARLLKNGGRLPASARKLSQAELDKMSAEEFTEWLNARNASDDGEANDDSEEAEDRAEMLAMNRLDVKSFTEELDRWKLRGT